MGLLRNKKKKLVATIAIILLLSTVAALAASQTVSSNYSFTLDSMGFYNYALTGSNTSGVAGSGVVVCTSKALPAKALGVLPTLYTSSGALASTNWDYQYTTRTVESIQVATSRVNQHGTYYSNSLFNVYSDSDGRYHGYRSYDTPKLTW